MEKFNVVPRGDVKITKNYGVNTVSFENGNKQFQRKWKKPRISYAFSIAGDKEFRNYVDAFLDKVFGNLRKFTWEYDGKERTVRFSESSIDWTDIRGYEGEGIVGCKAEITLEEVKDSE